MPTTIAAAFGQQDDKKKKVQISQAFKQTGPSIEQATGPRRVTLDQAFDGTQLVPYIPTPAPQRVVKDKWWQDPESTERILNDPNVKAFLDVVAEAEGTFGGERGIGREESYRVGFNYTPINTLQDHPGQAHRLRDQSGKEITTTAAGRYQFIGSTWNSLKELMNLPDFGPRSQDLAALEIARQEGALPSILAGDIRTAVEQVNARNTQWASLPSAQAAQPKRDWEQVTESFNRYVLEHGAVVAQNTYQDAKEGGFRPFADPWRQGVNTMLQGGAAILDFYQHIDDRVAEISPFKFNRLELQDEAAKIRSYAQAEWQPAQRTASPLDKNPLYWAYRTVAENLPLMAGLMAGSLANPALGVSLMAGVEGGSALQELENWEATTGQKVDPMHKDAVVLTVGALNAALEKTGIDKILKVGHVSGLKGRLLQLGIAAMTEGGTEGAQEIVQALGESTYEGRIPEDIGERFVHALGAGMLLGAVGGAGTAALSKLGRPLPNDTELADFVDPGTGQLLEPRFRVIKGGHRLSGTVVTAREAQDAGLQLPAFRRELMKRQIMHTMGRSELEAEAGLRLLDLRARKLGMNTEEFISQYLKGFVSGVSADPSDLRQDVGPVFYSKMQRELQKAGLPKKAKARDYLKAIKSLSDKGKFKSDEFEWSGLQEYVEWIEEYYQQGMLDSDQISRDELFHQLELGGPKLREIFTQYNADGRRIAQRVIQAMASELRTSTAFHNYVLDTYGEYHVQRELEAEGWAPEAFTNPDGTVTWVNNRDRVLNLPPDQVPISLDLIEETVNSHPTPDLVESWGVSEEIVEQYRELEKFSSYHNYAIPGARNFREMILSWENAIQQLGNFEVQNHFPFIKNPIAFTLISDRYATRPDRPSILDPSVSSEELFESMSPLKVLLLEQIQSDWHQAGRRAGYSLPGEIDEARQLYEAAQAKYREITNRLGISDISSPADVIRALAQDAGVDIDWYQTNYVTDYVLGYGREYQAGVVESILQKFKEKDQAYVDRIEELREANQAFAAYNQVAMKVPPAPWAATDAWVDLILKRMIRHAVEQGYDYIALPTPEMVLNATGGEISGHEEFYGKIVPKRLQKIAKGKVRRIDINNRDKGLYQYSSRRSPETYNVLALQLTEEVKNRALQGYPLFQGSKGAFSIANDGRAVIKALSSPDVSTMIHEIGHLFRRTLTPEELDRAAKAFGVKDPDNWTRSEEEHFARAWERWFYEGKTTHTGLKGLFHKFKQWLVEVYGELAGSDIDVPMTRNMRSFFNSMIEDVMPTDASVEVARDWWQKTFDWFDVEGRFRRLGQPETGFRIKNFYSEQERHIVEARKLTQYISKKLGRNQEKISSLVLAAESETLSAQIMQSGDQNMIDALVALRDYFDRSLHEYKASGAISKGFKELLLDSLNERIQGILGRQKLSTKDVTELTKLVHDLEAAKDIQFVHIPLTFWYEAYAAQSPTGARAALAVLKERKTPRIQDLIDRGIIRKEDIKLADILLSYGLRKGKDMGFLKIRNAALVEGAAKPKMPGAQNSFGYVSAPIRASFMKGYELNRPLSDWVQGLLQTDRLSRIRDIINTTKMGAFWNPLLLNTYNTIQLALTPAINHVGLPKYAVRAWLAVHNRDESFYEAEENGVSSQPFVSPLEDLRLKFAQAEEGAVIANLRNTFANSNDSILTNVAKAPFRMLKALYQASWDSAWYFDRVSRQVLYEYLKDQGHSPREAAQFSARVFGDYASVPFNTRRTLNTVLFTPTYKIAMGKLYYDSVRGIGSLFRGDQSQGAKIRAGVAIRTLGIVVGFHLFMKALGWEDDQPGRRYFKTVEADPSISPKAGVGPKELVLVFGGPHDLFYKMFLRITDSFKPEVENPLQRWFTSNKWEIQPIFRVTSDIVNNKGQGGQPIFYVTDSAEIKSWKIFKYGLSQLVPMLSALAKADPSQSLRAVVEENELSPQGTALFEQEYGNFFKIITGEYRLTAENILRPVSFVYARDITPIRVREQVERMQLILEQEIGARSVKDAIMRGETPEELQERIESIGPRVNNVLGRINRILDRLEDYHYETPVDAYIHEEPKRTVPLDSAFAQ